jgi:hypothetical protein
MRARHRHFNARDCDAALCLDARFISGLSDADPVTTWNDRTRNGANATQSTAQNKPSYKTSIQGGQPVVRFDGSNDRMTHTCATLNDSCVIVVGKTTDNGNQQRYFGTGTNGTTVYTFIGNRNGVVSFASNNFASASFSNYSFAVVTWSISGTNISFFNNRGSESSATFTKYTANPFDPDYRLLGAGGIPTNLSSFLNGDIAFVAAYSSNIATSLQKRCEHAAAYSFKISCN